MFHSMVTVGTLVILLAVGAMFGGDQLGQRAIAVAQEIPRPPSAPFPRIPRPPAAAGSTGDRVVRDHRRGFDFDLAYYHAPIHYQDTNNDKYLADYITRVDYDGDWVATNNWDNLRKYPLRAFVYYSVVETCTHWFLTYSFFHPQDWSNMGGQEHENDMEGVLTIVRKNGARFGALEGMVTTFHHDFYSYTPSGSPLRDGPWLNTGGTDTSGNPIRTRQDIDGRLTMQSYDGTPHPLTNQEDKGHGVKAFPFAGNFLTGNGLDGIIYYPSRIAAEVPQSGNDRDVKYGLLDIFEPEGLWHRQLKDLSIAPVRDHREGARPADQRLGLMFHHWGTFRGDKSGGCGGQFLGCKENSPHTAWGWDDTGFSIASSADVGVYAGEMALDPAHLVKQYFTDPGLLSENYLRNQYLSDLRNQGYHQDKLPSGWPRELNLNQLYGKLTTTCQ